MSSLRIALIAILLFLSHQTHAAGLFPDDAEASPYHHDAVAVLAAKLLLDYCGEDPLPERAARLLQRRDWNAPESEAPAGVTLRQQPNFAGEAGLVATFRLGRNSCTLVLEPYLPNQRAADELAYGVSEAVAKAFADEDAGWTPEQAFSGWHRIGAVSTQFQLTQAVQGFHNRGVPSLLFFTLLDLDREQPRVVLGQRRFGGQFVFGMVDSDWKRRRNKLGTNILAIQANDPVDPDTGGFNTLALTRNGDNFQLKTWFPIGGQRDVFRLKPALGADPLKGFERLSIAVREDDKLVIRRIDAGVVDTIPAKQAMLSKGLYPVYLDIPAGSMRQLVEAEYFTLELVRTSGSGIHLQVPAGERFHSEVETYLGGLD